MGNNLIPFLALIRLFFIKETQFNFFQNIKK